MYRHRGLSLALLSLLVLLILQLGVAAREGRRHQERQRPAPKVQATWAYLAKSLSEATNLSQDIVLANVTQVQIGPDLPGCAAEDDQIGVNLVTMSVEQVYKGNPGQGFLLFQTAPIVDVKSDTLNQPRGTLHDDPLYATGERYLLFLRSGPMVGTSSTKAMLAPEGRYRVNNGVLESFTPRGLAQQLAGMTLQEFEQQLFQLDTDDDGVPDRIDNCPTCPNPNQNLPPWPVPPDDPDCDGFSTKMDDFTGGLPLVACPATPTPGDEVRDAWPPDLNDDQRVDNLDAQLLQPLLGATDVSDCDTIPEDVRYNHRMDLNADYVITSADLAILNSFQGQSCLGCPYTTWGPAPANVRTGLVLSQNEPNPFDPAVRIATTISFVVPASSGRAARTTLRIYDSNGRLVRTVVDAVLAPERHSVDWDGRDETGRRLGSGVYFYRLDVGGATTTKKMVLLSFK